MNERFTIEKALEFQRQHLQEWEMVLNEEAYDALVAHIEAETAKLPANCDPYDIPRGESLSRFVRNYASSKARSLKTIGEWMGTMPEPYRSLAKKYSSKSWGETRKTFCDAMYAAFAWNGTDEGHAFWSRVANWPQECWPEVK